MEIARGAEAVIIKEKGIVLKKRLPKSYRIKEIDNKLLKTRTKKESNILKKLQNIIPVPKILETNYKTHIISMEFIDGKKLSDNFDKFPKEKRKKVARAIGKQIAEMHNQHIIHGDLTTSNMILKNKLYFIDFGLGYVHENIEHKAVDLHLLRQAFESKHYKHAEESLKIILKEYKKHSKQGEQILKRLTSVERRGRYKERSPKKL